MDIDEPLPPITLRELYKMRNYVNDLFRFLGAAYTMEKQGDEDTNANYHDSAAERYQSSAKALATAEKAAAQILAISSLTIAQRENSHD